MIFKNKNLILASTIIGLCTILAGCVQYSKNTKDLSTKFSIENYTDHPTYKPMLAWVNCLTFTGSIQLRPDYPGGYKPERFNSAIRVCKVLEQNYVKSVIDSAPDQRGATTAMEMTDYIKNYIKSEIDKGVKAK